MCIFFELESLVFAVENFKASVKTKLSFMIVSTSTVISLLKRFSEANPRIRIVAPLGLINKKIFRETGWV